MKRYLKHLIGFPIGVTMLAVTYILIGAVEASEIYTNEIMKLNDYKYLFAQVFLSGVSYLIVAYTVNFLVAFYEKNRVERNMSWGGLVKYILGLVVIPAICFGVIQLVDRRGTLNNYVGEVFMEITVLGLIAAVIISIINDLIQCRKINKALKEKQAKEKD